MTISFKKAIGSSMLAALVAGGVALTAVAPASAATVDTGLQVKAAVQGDRIEGPWIMTSNYTNSASPASPYLYTTSGTTFLPITGGGTTRANAIASAVTASFPAVGTTGPVMIGGQCITQGTLIPSGFPVTLAPCSPGAANQEFATNADGSITYPSLPGTYLQFSGTGAPGVGLVQIATAAQTQGEQYVERLDLTALTPVIVADCTAGLTGTVANIDQSAHSAVVSGTGAAGETITVTGSPTGAVTATVGTDGSWTATIPGLVEGDNALSVTSSDNCAPVELSVIIEPLEIPVMHPAAASAAVLGLGVLGLVGLRRRKTARI